MKRKNIAFTVIMISILMTIAVPMTFAQDEQTAMQAEQATILDEQAVVQDEQADVQDEQSASVSNDIRIEDAAICRSVEDRMPIGAGDVFSSDQQKLACFSRVVGAKEDTEITHNWYFGDTMMASISLHVGSSNWRTYSLKNILPEQTGEWKVEILAQNGELLKRIYFMVQE